MSLQTEKHKAEKHKAQRQAEYPEDEVDRFLRAAGRWFVVRLAQAKLIDVFGIVMSVIIAVVGTVAAFIYDGQLQEMRHTNQLTQQALDGSADTLKKTLEKLQGQIDATDKLYGEAQKQTANSRTLAVNSGTQAGATITGANAAQSAAETAKETLTISQRAYVFAGAPTLDSNGKNVAIPINNTGHVPSGAISITAHEATINLPGPYFPSARYKPVEVHWKKSTLETATPNVTGLNVNVPTPAGEIDKINTGFQQIILAGTIIYGDGLSGDEPITVNFCYGTIYYVPTKTLSWSPCESSSYLKELIIEDKYPDNEYK